MRRVWVVFLLLFTLGFIRPGSAEVPLKGFTVLTTASEKDIQDLAGFGANVARLMMICPNVDSLPREAYDAWLIEEMTRIDRLLPILRTNKVKVIINLHTPPGGFASYGALPKFRLFTEAWAQDAFSHTWELLSSRYGKNKSVTALQLLSEPAVGAGDAPGLLRWEELSRKVIGIIRKQDKRHPIIISPAYANPNRLRKMRPVRQLGPIRYAVHYYQPMEFTHQGISDLPQGVPYPSSTFTQKTMVSGLRGAQQIAKKHGYKVYVTEFSVSGYADSQSASRYLTDLLTIFDKYGWGWMYHAWREADVWNVEIDPIAREGVQPDQTARAVVLKKFMSNR